MEPVWNEVKQEVTILEELIHAYDSEPVRAAIANWQQEVMKNGPAALELDKGNEQVRKL